MHTNEIIRQTTLHSLTPQPLPSLPLLPSSLQYEVIFLVRLIVYVTVSIITHTHKHIIHLKPGGWSAQWVAFHLSHAQGLTAAQRLNSRHGHNNINSVSCVFLPRRLTVQAMRCTQLITCTR